MWYRVMIYIEDDWIVTTGNNQPNHTDQFNGNMSEYVMFKHKYKNIAIKKMINEYGGQVKTKQAIINMIEAIEKAGQTKGR